MSLNRKLLWPGVSVVLLERLTNQSLRLAIRIRGWEITPSNPVR
jgi:hypothetical protein